jgi:hypothetical protein
MAKSSGSGKSKKAAKPESKKKAKKKGADTVDRLLSAIQKRNQAIMKEARKIDDMISTARMKSAGPTALADDLCTPTLEVKPNGGG